MFNLKSRLRSILFPRSLPQFIIVGVQKGGTTSLYDYLCQIPQVWSAATKEVHYFDINFDRGMNWYHDRFPIERELELAGALTGEASPYYLFHPHAIARIKATVPEARLIVCLRNPVDRAISHYWHNVKKGREPLSISDAFAAEPERLKGEDARMYLDPTYVSYNHQHYSYLSRGYYADQLHRLFQHFSREQVLIIKSEDLFTDAKSTTEYVCEHIGLATADLSGIDFSPQNVGKKLQTEDSDLRCSLSESYAEPNLACIK